MDTCDGSESMDMKSLWLCDNNGESNVNEYHPFCPIEFPIIARSLVLFGCTELGMWLDTSSSHYTHN
jgi:hypothetical protein